MMEDAFDRFCERIDIIVAIDHAGRAGNGFFQAIFDQHPEIITCPWIHYVYSYICDTWGEADELDSEAVRRFWTETAYFRFLYREPDPVLDAQIRKFGGDPDAPLDRDRVRRTFDAIVGRRPTIRRKELVVLTYYCHALGTGREIEKLHYILTADSISLRHETVFGGFSGRILDLVRRDFEAPRLVHLVRDPRAGFASTNHQFVNSLGNMYGIRWGSYWHRFGRLVRLDFDWDSVFVFGFWLLYFRQTFAAAMRRKSDLASLFYTVKNEDLNLSFVPTLERLCAWLGVSMLPGWRDASYAPTMLGRPWTGTGGYNSQYQQHRYGPLPNDPPEVASKVTGPNAYVTQRWRQRLARHEIYLIERLLAPELEAFDYPFLEYKHGRRGTRALLVALFRPLRGELPRWRWIATGRRLGAGEVANRLFYSISFPLFYVAARLAMLRIIRRGTIFST